MRLFLGLLLLSPAVIAACFTLIHAPFFILTSLFIGGCAGAGLYLLETR